MEETVVIYQSKDDSTIGCWLIPNLMYDLEWICKRDIPVGSPYVILSSSQLPFNYYNELNCYTFDFSNPDGWGSGSYNLQNSPIVYPATFDMSHDEWIELKASSSL
jgi:hypothetical protein